MLVLILISHIRQNDQNKQIHIIQTRVDLTLACIQNHELVQIYVSGLRGQPLTSHTRQHQNLSNTYL